jgi:transcriptional regulator with XRE-family HTH domain
MNQTGETDASTAAGWRSLLRTERHRLGLTQVELANRAGVAPDTLRKYESGGRTPSRASIERMLGALQVPQVTVRLVLRELGFASAETLYTLENDPDYQFTIPQLRVFVEQNPWPQFVVNNVLEIVTANAAAQALWGIDLAAEFERRSRAQLNFLAIAAERRFSERIGNWAEMLVLAVSLLKAIPQSKTLLDEPGSLFGEVFAAFAKNDPTAIPKLFSLWERTPPASAKVRFNYPVVWREPGIGEIRFIGTVTTASEPDALAFNDWIPEDAASHALLEKVIAAPSRLRGEAGRPRARLV